MNFLMAQNHSILYGVGSDIQLCIEGQSYRIKGFRNSQFVDIEKSAGMCSTLKVEFTHDLQLGKYLLSTYNLGYKINNQKFHYSEFYSSNLDYHDMGSSQINSQYITFFLGFSYNKSPKGRLYFLPYINAGLDMLVKKSEEINPLKYTFSDIQNPYSAFYSIVPEFSIDFLFFHVSKNKFYKVFFGPGLKNNPKYYSDKKGILFFPISFYIKLGITKT